MTTEQILLYALIAFIVYYIGKKVWLFRTIKQYSPVDAFQKMKKERNIIFLDVRTPQERKQSSIKGSFHIPLAELRSKDQELKKFKDTEIICYCRTGNRSLNAASKLKRMGFNASNLSGGIIRWNNAGYR